MLGSSACGVAPYASSLSAPDTAEYVLIPLANAGADREISRGLETFLNGRSTHHPGHQPFTTKWQQLDGEPVYLSNPTDLSPSFVAPLEEQTLVFRLEVTDGQTAVSDEVALFVRREPRRVAPRIRAGPDRFLALNESPEPKTSDLASPVSDDVVVSWQRLTSAAGNPTRITGTHGDQPAVYRLTGQRDGLESAPDFLVLWPFHPDWQANAAPLTSLSGPSAVAPNTVVVLDAAATSDPNGDPFDLRWEQVCGPPLFEPGLTTSTLSVITPARVPQEICFRVFARDAFLESSPTEHAMVVGANAGLDLPQISPSADQRTRPGRTVVLDALGGTADPVDPPVECDLVWQQTFGGLISNLTSSDQGRFLYLVAPTGPDELAFSVFARLNEVESLPAVARVTVVSEEENLPPKIYDLVATPNRPEPEEPMQITARILDPEADPVTCEIRARSPGRAPLPVECADDCALTDSGNLVASLTAPVGPDTIVIVVWARDDRGGATSQLLIVALDLGS